MLFLLLSVLVRCRLHAYAYAQVEFSLHPWIATINSPGLGITPRASIAFIIISKISPSVIVTGFEFRLKNTALNPR